MYTTTDNVVNAIDRRDPCTKVLWTQSLHNEGFDNRPKVEARSTNQAEPGELNSIAFWNKISPANQQSTYLPEFFAHIAPCSHTARVKINRIS